MPISSQNARARVGGSGFTVFVWDNEPIAFARQISHQSATPVGPGAVPIHPMDAPYPVEIITPAAGNMGSITLELYELYGQKVWDRLKSLTGSVDIVDIFIKVAARDTAINLFKYVVPPTGAGVPPYIEKFYKCVITNVQDGETIEVGTMEILKTITVAYAYTSRDHVLSSAFDLASRPLPTP